MLALLGVVAAQRGHLDEADALLGAALRHDPDHAEAHNNLGNLRQMQERFDEALACHRRATELRPEHATAQFNLAVAFAAVGRLDEAATSYLRCLELRPDLAAAHHNLGLVRQRQGQLDDAVASLTRAIELAPGDAAAHENLGVAFRSQRRFHDAAASFQRAVDLDPSRRRLEHLIDAYTGRTTDAAPDHYVADLFDHLAADFDDYLVKVLGYRTPALLKGMLREVIDPDDRFRRVLDLGCGTGLMGVELAPSADELCGVDLSPKMLDRARARGIYHRLDAAGIDAFLDAVDGTFDLVVAADVFVYIGDLVRTFAGVRRRAEDGALFLFSTEIATAGDFVLNPTGRYGHAKSYVERVATETGFTVVRCTSGPLRMENEEVVVGDCWLLQAD